MNSPFKKEQTIGELNQNHKDGGQLEKLKAKILGSLIG